MLYIYAVCLYMVMLGMMVPLQKKIVSILYSCSLSGLNDAYMLIMNDHLDQNCEILSSQLNLLTSIVVLGLCKCIRASSSVGCGRQTKL